MQNNTFYLPLELVKQHCSVDEWYDGDDFYLMHLIEVVQTSVEKHIDQKLETLEDENGDIPAPLTHAMLLLCGQYYNDRESVTHSNAVQVPLSFNYLIDLYRNYAPSLDKKKHNNCKICKQEY